jgi:hypothetical protein
MKRRLAALGLTAAAGVLAFGGAANAALLKFQGSMANGACGPVYPVDVSGPSRIEVLASSTATETSPTVSTILDASGNVLADYSYDTKGGGTFGVRVCSTFDSANPSQLAYTGIIATGPAGRSALHTATRTHHASSRGRARA